MPSCSSPTAPACIRRSRRSLRHSGTPASSPSLQGVGYPAPNLSHFRSIEIWDTASRSDQYLPTGWLTRTFAAAPPPAAFAADGVVIGSNDLGPLDGGGRARSRSPTPTQFLRRAHLDAAPSARQPQPRARAHPAHRSAISCSAAARFDGDARLRDAAFRRRRIRQRGAHGMPRACGEPDGRRRVCASRRTATTRTPDQAATQARLLASWPRAWSRSRRASTSSRRWNDTLLLTYAEFGRRPHENAVGRHRSRHGERAFRARWTRRRRACTARSRRWRAFGRRQSRARDRFPQRLCDGARALVGHRFARGAGRPLRYAADPPRLRPGAARINAPGAVPRGDECAPVRRVGRADALAHERNLARVLAGVELAAHQAEALVDEIRVQHVASRNSCARRRCGPRRSPRRRRRRPCRACRESRTAARSRRARRSRAAGTARRRPSGRDGACESARGSC